MAIIDSLLRFSDGQSVTAAAESTDTVDLGSADVDLGTGENLYFEVVATSVSGTNPSATVKLQSHTAATGTFVDVDGIEVTITSAGKHTFRLPVGTVDDRYLRVNYSSVTGTTPVFTIDAYITKDIDQYTAYRSGYTVNT